MQVRIYGKYAIVTGRFTGKWREKGKPVTSEERFTSIWIKDGDRWKAVSEHASQLPATVALVNRFTANVVRPV